jgi:hypothetical protein
MSPAVTIIRPQNTKYLCKEKAFPLLQHVEFYNHVFVIRSLMMAWYRLKLVAHLPIKKGEKIFGC